MLRLLIGCGALLDTLLTSVSFFATGEVPWVTSVMLGLLSIGSLLVLTSAKVAYDAFQQPDMLAPRA